MVPQPQEACEGVVRRSIASCVCFVLLSFINYVLSYKTNQFFLDKYISVLDQYMTALASFDFYYHMADDSRAYKAGQAQADNLVQLYTKLSAADKKRAHDQYTKINKTSTEFKQFRGA